MTEQPGGAVADAEHAIDRYLGVLEAAVMRVAWRVGPVTVRDVLSALNADRGRPLAYTTVMTIMGRLAEKGMLRRTRVGRADLYEPSQSAAGFLRALSRRRIRSLIEDFGELAIAEFYAELDQVDPEQRRRLRRLAARARREDR